MLLNSSSNVCLCAHSTSVTYLHLLWCGHILFGGGDRNHGFFTILQVGGNMGSYWLFAFVVRGRCMGLDDEYVAVAVLNGVFTFATLSWFVFHTRMFGLPHTYPMTFLSCLASYDFSYRFHLFL